MKNILIAEDEHHIRDLIALTLKLQNMHVTTGKNGADAIAHSAETTFDIILLDVRMPKVTGIEAAHAIRTHCTNANTPILFLSGENSVDLSGIENCSRLIKPFAVNDLLTKINAILNTSTASPP